MVLLSQVAVEVKQFEEPCCQGLVPANKGLFGFK